MLAIKEALKFRTFSIDSLGLNFRISNTGYDL